jgi:hypothetical protein
VIAQRALTSTVTLGVGRSRQDARPSNGHRGCLRLARDARGRAVYINSLVSADNEVGAHQHLHGIALDLSRHTTHLAYDRSRRQGEGARDLQRHASVAITYDRYGHLMPGTRTRRPRCSTRTSSVRTTPVPDDYEEGR